MATSPANNSFELTKVEKELIVRSISTYRATVKRAMNAERDSAIVDIRAAQIRELDALEARFR
nr:MAG: hypothetical protein [Microvirus sp.]